MSSLLDSEASEVSDLSDDENTPVKQKPNKPAIPEESSDSEEEEELENEEEICRKEGEGWIVDEEEEVEGSGESDDDSDAVGRSRDSEQDDDDALDDDDYQLIRDNIGVDLKKKKKRRLIIEDDEGEGDEVPAKKATHDKDGYREAVARQIFEDEDEEGVADEPVNRVTNFRVTGDYDEGDEYSDDLDDFIVDDRTGRPPTKPTRRIVHQDAALQEAQDIFGVDFDMSEFESFRKDQTLLDQYSSDSDIEYSDEEMSARARRKSRRSRSRLLLDEKVYEYFDPSDLERAFYSQADERIRMTDCPERFQLRHVPVKCINPQSSTYENDLRELADEADWIYRQAFKDNSEQKNDTMVTKITEALKLMRESLFEVPFIAFYRKEFADRDLNIKDLWRIYQLDEKWTLLQQRKRSMVRLLQRLSEFLDEVAPKDVTNVHRKCVQSLMKLIACARSADSLDELMDVRLNYQLYFARYVELLKSWSKRKRESESGVSVDLEAELAAVEKATPSMTSVDPFTGRRIRQRSARATASYEVAHRAGLSGLVERFGLSAAQFAENVQDQYLRHDVDQCPMLPLDAASDFLCPQFPSHNSALAAARYMLAFEISREPLVRRMLRQMFQLQAVISVGLTERGLKEIDESHPLFPIRYLKEKPLADLMGSELFLHLENASRENLVQYRIHVPSDQIRGLSLIDELQRFFYQDEFSALVQAWNDQRTLVLKQAAEQFIFPTLIRELRDRLIEASQETVLRLCAQKLFTALSVAPYPPDGHRSYETDAEVGSSPFEGRRDDRGLHAQTESSHQPISGAVWPKGARVLALALKDEDDARQSVVSAVHLDSDGEVVDFLHLHGLTYSRHQGEQKKKMKERDMQRLSAFMLKHRPQVVVVGCDCRRALYLQEDMQRLIEDLAQERRLPRIHVELLDTELSVVFARSARASSDLPSSYSPLLRQAISLGRRLQDPLAEFAQLANTEEELLGLRWHPLQDSLSRDRLLQALEIEFINRVNEVGVDVNRCLAHPHTAGVVQFISGLGPRKSLYMLKLLRHKKRQLTNRMELVTVIGFGPRVVVNCAGFIKIDTGSVLDAYDDVELLDSTRVHPESYDLAKKMAVDALEYEDTEDSDPSAALKEILDSPARLRELDLDAFAEELRRQEHGDKHITLYDIRKELTHRYRDYRVAYRSANPETVFSLVTHETPDTLHIGRLVECRVVALATRRPRPEQLDQANPSRNEDNGCWVCPFCRQDNFQMLNNVWAHFDNKECPGQPVGLRVQLDNGISGFVPLRFTDPPAEKLFARAQPNSLLQCRVLKIDIARFNVELTCRAADLKDERYRWRARPDPFFDYEAEQRDVQREAELAVKAEKQKQVAYLSRVIFHPYFKNISYDQLAAMEPQLETGAIVIRPSRKGTDHLTVSWKVDDGIVQHIDVSEREKTNSFSLGKLLIIGDEEFEDLDEIVARHVQPMVSLVRDIMTYRYYRDSMGGDQALLTNLLQKEKAVNPDRIPYFLSATKERPGYFILAYMPNQRAHFELFSVRPEGFRFRRLIFPNLDRMLTWFKEHYNDAANVPVNYRSAYAGPYERSSQRKILNQIAT